ncbi:MAG: hypothetical protein ACRDYU_10855 [Actinomycetes bacterium]
MPASTSRRGRPLRAAVAVFAAASLAAAGCAKTSESDQAAAQGEFPEKITMTIPFSEGGGTDTWARFMDPYLEKNLPNEPAILPENVPAGEGITGPNQFVEEGSTDGTEVLAASGTTYFQWMLRHPQVKYDFSKMRPLLVNGTGGAIYSSSAAGLRDASDLANPPKPLTYAGISASGLDLSMLIAFDLLDVNIDATWGLEGRDLAVLAMERGEVNIDYQTTSAYKSDVQPMVDEGKAVPLMSFGVLEDGKVVRDPALPDLPTVPEVYEQLNGEPPSGPAWDAYKAFLAAGFDYQKGLWANQGTPDEIVSAYQDSVKPMTSDPKFQKGAEEALGGYPLSRGDEVETEMREAFTITSAVRKYALDLLATKYDTKFG